MARIMFKDFMNTLMSNQYHFFEKALYQLTAGMQLYVVMMFHMPIREIKVWEPKRDEGTMINVMLSGIAIVIYLFGAVYAIVSFIDMWNCDMIGFYLPEGLD